MKRHLLEFARRGLTACGIGPIVLAAIYLLLQHHGVVKDLSVNEVSLGIFSLTALAFVAGGMNVVYQIERLPLMAAISIHGGVLYIGYLLTYLLNDWLDWGVMPILAFTGIFVLGYLVIWVIIYCIIKRNTERINKILKEKQKCRE